MASSSRRPHLVRGSIAAAIATFAALFSHVIGGGEMPAPLGIAAPLVLSLLICTLLAGRKLSLARLSISVVVSQTLFHTLFVLGAPGTSAAGQANMPAGHHHGTSVLQLSASSDHMLSLIHGDPLMWFSHLVGAAVTIFFLYRGERAIHHLRLLAEQAVAWLRYRLTAPLRIPVTLEPARATATQTSGWTVLAQQCASTVSRRGPPDALRIAS